MNVQPPENGFVWIEDLLPYWLKFFVKNGKNRLSKDLASYGYSPWLIILLSCRRCHPRQPFSITVVPSCLNHPPQKEYCLLSCHASYGAASSYSGDICLEHHRKSTPIRLFSTVSQRLPSSCFCTHDSKSSRFCRAHGSSSTASSKRDFSSTGSWPSCLSSDSGPSRP